MGINNSKLAELKALAQSQNSGGSRDYFTLKDDGDSAVVVFLLDDETEDLIYGKVYSVELPIEGKNKTVKKYVEVIDEKTDPLAKAGYKPMVRALFELVEVDKDTGEMSDIKIWDRGPQHINQIIGFAEEFGSLKTHPIKIKRYGAKGDRNTRYDMFPLTADSVNNFNPDALPEPRGNEDGRYIMHLTQEEMQQVVDGKYFLEDFSDEKETVDTVQKPQGNNYSQPSQPQQPNNQQQQQPPQSPPPKQDGKGGWIIPVWDPQTRQWYYPNEQGNGNKNNNTNPF